jgi:hypothetical protein
MGAALLGETQGTRAVQRARKLGLALRVPFTMTQARGFGTMIGMRNVVILAMVAIGAVRIMWRVLGPAEQHASAMEWTAGE